MFWLCRTCGVEHAATPAVCAICADERQWVPREGQQWATLDELAGAGVRSTTTVIEPGFVDDAAVTVVREQGSTVAIIASHPHMFGAQVEWSRRLGGVPVYVNAADAEWVMRPDPVITHWSDTLQLTPTLSVIRVGGHFPGSAAACWSDGADGRGVLLVGDTIFPNPDRRTVSFLRSYPNRIPLSAAVVRRMADTLTQLRFDRIYGLFTNAIESDAAAAVEFSARRHIAWVRGDHDELT